MTYQTLTDLNGVTAVVTGANGDIAQATMQRLAKHGAKIIALVYRNPEQTLNNLPGTGHEVLLCNVTDTASIQQAVSQIHSCDILINNAGKTQYIAHGNLSTLTDEIFDDILTANLRSAFAVTREFLPLLNASQDAVIVNIGSTAGVRKGGSNLAYAAAKAGVDNLTRNLSIALAPIRVISICPGAVDTKFLAGRPKEFLESVAEHTPLGRMACADDVAAAIEAYTMTLRFVTGENIVVDGGRSI